MWWKAFFAVTLIVLAVLAIDADVVTATQWIPRAGHRHSPPTLAGYIALYGAWTLLNLVVWTWLITTSRMIATRRPTR